MCIRLFKHILELSRRMIADGQTFKHYENYNKQHYKINNKQPNISRGEREQYGSIINLNGPVGL